MKNQILLIVLTGFTNIVLCQTSYHSTFINSKNDIAKIRLEQRYAQKRMDLNTGILDSKNTYRLDSIIEYNFNDDTDQWDVKFTKDSYYYNKNNKDTLFEYSYWNSDKEIWDKVYAEINTYNESEKLISFASYNVDSSIRYPFYKEEYTYNNELLRNTIEYYWKYDLDKWIPSSNTHHNYNSTGILITDSVYTLNDDGSIKYLSKKSNYLYSNNNLDTVITWHRNNETKDWKNYELIGNLYHPSKKLLIKTSKFDWDNEDSTWVINYNIGYSYNLDGYLKESLKLEFATEMRSNETLLRQSYTYDNSVSENELILPFIIINYDLGFFHHMVISNELSKKSEDDDEETKYREIKYYYSEIGNATGTDLETAEKIKVYPVPANDYVYFNLQNEYKNAHVEILTTNGQCLLRQRIIKDNPLYLSNLKKGMYLYLIILEHEIVSGKLVVE